MTASPLPPERRRRGLLVPLGTASAGVLVLSATLYGARATASMPSSSGGAVTGSAGTGSLSLVLQDRGAGFDQPVSGLAPGDVVVRDVDLVGGGTLRGRGLSVLVTTDRPGPLVSDGPSTRGLRVTIGACDAPGRPGTRCPVPVRVLLSLPLDRLGTTPVDLGLPALQPGRRIALQVELALPEQDETTRDGARPAASVQDQAVRLRWTFRTTQ